MPEEGRLRNCSGGIAQNEDEIEEKLNFRICPNSTISLLASRYGMSNMRCFPIGGMKKQHDATLKSFGTTQEVIYSLTRLPSTTYSLLLFSLFDFKNLKTLKFPLSLPFSIFENILRQILT